MVDGSHLPLKDNISYTKHISFLAHSKNMLVEAELGRLSGTEDDLTVEDYEARLTDLYQVIRCPNSLTRITNLITFPSSLTRITDLVYSHSRHHICLSRFSLFWLAQLSSLEFQAEEFIDETGIDALAVCIGNVHGKYPASGPNLRLDLLKVKYKQSLLAVFNCWFHEDWGFERMACCHDILSSTNVCFVLYSLCLTFAYMRTNIARWEWGLE